MVPAEARGRARVCLLRAQAVSVQNSPARVGVRIAEFQRCLRLVPVCRSPRERATGADACPRAAVVLLR